MLLIGLLARLQLRRLDGIAYLIDLGPGEPFLLELIDNLAYLAPIYHAGLFYLDLYIGLAGEGDDGQYWQRLIILQDTSQRSDVAGILDTTRWSIWELPFGVGIVTLFSTRYWSFGR